MEMYYSIKDWCEKLPKYIAEKKERVGIAVTKDIEVSYSANCDFNKEYCDANNIPYFYRRGNGGTIVCAKGNVCIGFIYDNRKYKKIMLAEMLNELAAYFRSCGLSATRNRNDILVDGYKVASGMAVNLSPDYRWTSEAAQISVNQEIDLIKKICTKPMEKEPKGLSEYGITTEEIAQWCSEWLTTHLGISLADSAQT